MHTDLVSYCFILPWNVLKNQWNIGNYICTLVFLYLPKNSERIMPWYNLSVILSDRSKIFLSLSVSHNPKTTIKNFCLYVCLSYFSSPNFNLCLKIVQYSPNLVCIFLRPFPMDIFSIFSNFHPFPSRGIQFFLINGPTSIKLGTNGLYWRRNRLA